MPSIAASQISENEDKKALEVSPSSARTRIFYQSAEDCATARKKLENTLKEMQAEKESKLQIDEQEVRPLGELFDGDPVMRTL